MSKFSKNKTSTDDFNFEIIETLGVLREATEKKWALECNVVSWNGRPAKVDIREWREDHDKMSKGISLTDDEAYALMKCLAHALDD